MWPKDFLSILWHAIGVWCGVGLLVGVNASIIAIVAYFIHK